MANNDDTPPSPSSLFGVREVGSFVVAAAATAVTTWFAIGRRFGTNFGELNGKAKALHDTHQHEITRLYDQQHGHPVAGKIFIKTVTDARRKFEEESTEFVRRVGIHNTWDKLKELKPHQQLEVVFGAIAVFSVSFGVILGVARSKQLNKLLGIKNKDTEQQAERT
jgi:hypothetical protein